MNYRPNQYSNHPGSSRNTQVAQNAVIDKYRSILNLPARPTQKSKNSPIRHRGIQLSDQAAKLIALSIKGLLNS
jgi:hypothetical protein